jgi:Na+-driven multidrug efflux pump
MLANLIAYWVIGLPVAYFFCFRMKWGRSASGLDSV